MQLKLDFVMAKRGMASTCHFYLMKHKCSLQREIRSTLPFFEATAIFVHIRREFLRPCKRNHNEQAKSYRAILSLTLRTEIN